VRLGLVLCAAPGSDGFDSLVAQAGAAEAAGLDLAWLESGDGPALVSVAALAARTSVLRLAACVPAGAHPLEIAEGAAVADNCSNGRLVLVVEDVSGDRELLAETVDVLVAALASRPFRHDGARWQVPANLPENELPQERIAVTPSPAQLELPLWLAGPAAADVARERGLSHVSAEARAAADWAQTEALLARAAARLRRPAALTVDADEDGGFAVDDLVERLRSAQRTWGLDVAALRLPEGVGDAARLRAVHTIAAQVRPRVMLDELPRGLDSLWRAVLPT
jgi:alkanesulfonate monooxygenase SsuD/methylene tetrahydromethanopterin reductase-like flavin-dependent oxidoreductase (luciferase family)